LRWKHGTIRVFAHFYAAVLAAIRRDPTQAAPHAESLLALAREHEMPQWLAHATFFLGWTRWWAGNPDGQAGMQGLLLLRQGNVRHFEPLFGTLIAEIEARAVDVQIGLATLDAQLATVAETGEQWFLPEMHRIRGEILLKREAADTARAEEAFLTAIAIAQQQKAKSFELRAALALAKLYQSTGRAADAHTVLAPALAGFSPTPEFAEIAEAQTLLGTLAQSEDVKAATAARQRQAKLQISYANALIAARGHGALETSAAFARALELTAGIDDAAERFSALYGLWVGSLVRGELIPMREAAAAFLREVEKRPVSPEAGVAYRTYALARWYQGDYTGARHYFERVLAVLDRTRDRDLAFRFGQDQFVAAEIFLALVLWSLGEITEAARLAEAARQHATESGQIATLAYMHFWVGHFEAIRSNVARARRHAEALLALGREHSLALYSAFGALSSALARARLDRGETRALSAYINQGNKVCAPFYQGLLAEMEADGQGAEGALTQIDAALCVRAGIVS
jgi:tetratricopeptide (TPR) repeat protein